MRELGRVAVALAVLAAAAGSLSVSYPALGEEIVIPLNGSLSGFGPRGGIYYRGQTFLGPGGLAGELTVYAASPDRGKAKTRLLLTEVDTSSGIHPTNVLFESEILPIGHGFTALGDVRDGDVAVLRLTGKFLPEFGAREIVGEDVVLIKRPETGE